MMAVCNRANDKSDWVVCGLLSNPGSMSLVMKGKTLAKIFKRFELANEWKSKSCKPFKKILCRLIQPTDIEKHQIVLVSSVQILWQIIASTSIQGRWMELNDNKIKNNNQLLFTEWSLATLDKHRITRIRYLIHHLNCWASKWPLNSDLDLMFLQDYTFHTSHAINCSFIDFHPRPHSCLTRLFVCECVYSSCPHVGSHCEWIYQASHGISTNSPPETSVRLTDTHGYINRL